MIETFLQNQGLTAKEITIFLDLFRHGQSFASTIAHRTNIDRTTAYSVLKNLLRKGLIAQTLINDTKAYLPLSPEIFEDKIDQQLADIKSQKKIAQLFTKEVAQIQKSNFLKPKVQIFEGPEAIKNLYLHSFKKGKKQKSFLTLSHMPKPLENFLKKEFIAAKKRNNVHSKVIIADSKQAKRYASLDSQANRQTKIIKNHPFPLHAEIIIFGDKEVAIIDFHKQIYGMLIESETYQKTVETLFDYIWNTEA